ncbi:MAG TPA: TIGR02996 domain-containing protein [Kofleriaceae bacterium]|nr:TIGR02996 domain-containing protein [Kofleriaceae bacterium]
MTQAGDDDAVAALEAAILADPDDPAPYAVYADWLLERGDPRGELISLQLAQETGQRATGRRSLPAAIARHLEAHAGSLLGPLAALLPNPRDPLTGPLTWRRGFLDRVTLDGGRGRDLGAVVDDVVRHPSGRFLRALTLRTDHLDEAHHAVDALVARAPATLAELDFEVRDQPLDVTTLWPALPNLRRLNLAARAFDLGAVRIPRAERARFATTRLSVAAVRAIAAAPWPALQRLELRFGGRFEPTSSTIEDLRGLLVRGDLPALTHLKLRGCAYAGEALATLAGQPLARQLVVIDLSHGHVEREDLRALAGHLAGFPQLRELWLPSMIFPEAQRAIAGIAKHLVSDARAALDPFL